MENHEVFAMFLLAAFAIWLGSLKTYRLEFLLSMGVAVLVCTLGIAMVISGVCMPGKEKVLLFQMASYLVPLLLARAVVEIRQPRLRRIIEESPLCQKLRNMREQLQAVLDGKTVNQQG